MPILTRTPIRHLTQEEFGELAYSVMGCVFDIHRDFGRLFDEKIYKRELAHRHPAVQLEFPIEVTHGTFRKMQYLDLLVDGGAPFELKTVEALTHFLGGPAEVLQEVKVRTAEHKLGHQRFRLAAPRVAFAVTTLPEADPRYHCHSRCVVQNTDLEAILWANINLKRVTLTAVT